MKDKCNNCMGKGYISYYNHIADGICFKCKGKGYINVKLQKTNKNFNKDIMQNKSELTIMDYIHIKALKENEIYKNKKELVMTETIDEGLEDFFNFISE